jgi:SAM-dependent methyltransferase
VATTPPRRVGRALEQVAGALHLTRPAFRLWERLRGLRVRGVPDADADGVPLPSGIDMVQVIGGADVAKFLAGGREAAELITGMLAEQGADAATLEVLDFGCGCGRVARHWPAAGPVLRGCDVNRRLAAWCEENLPHMEASAIDPAPPTPYDAESFDLVYALSVFTHLTEASQRRWMEEMRRLLRPEGWLLFTVQGEAFRDRLTGSRRRPQREQFDRGELAVLEPEMEGSNRCSVYHPHEWVKREMLGGFELVEFVPSASEGIGLQDAYLVRRSGP